MDPVTHTLTGAALAGAGLRNATPLAAAAVVLAANAPDIDILAYVRGPYAALAFRRGWSHGPLAMVVLPFVVTGVLLGWDRYVRRRRRPDAPPARVRPLLLVSLAGVLTHPVLDWLNNYGIRFLMPFDRRWFYGDALFIIDPWVWLVLGAAVLLGRRRSGRTFARAGIGVFVAYAAAMSIADPAERRHVRDAAAAADIGPVRRVMVAPAPANPFAGYVIIETPSAYHRGSFHWLRTPRVHIRGDSLVRLPPDPVVAAAADTPDGRHFLTWARFPFYRVQASDSGYSVRIGDARYAEAAGAGSLQGVTVRLDGALRRYPD